MPLRRDEAIVLARYPFRERDLTVAMLTRGAGLLRALARRSRGIQSRLAAAAEPLALLRITYFESRRSALATLDEAEVVRSSFPLAARPRAWAAGQVVAELALAFCPPGQAQERAFRLVDRCLAALAAEADPLAVAHYALLWFLRLGGVLPELDRCRACGAEMTRGGLWDRERSELVCGEHASEGRVRLGAPAVAWLRRAQRTAVEEMPGPAPGEAAGWLLALQREFTERELASFRFLADLTRDPGQA